MYFWWCKPNANIDNADERVMCRHGKESWMGESVVFCAQERGLWRGNRKGAKTLFMCVPMVSLGEMLDMKRSLPRFQV